MTDDRPRCTRYGCNKRRYATWQEAQRDARAIRANNKNRRTLHVYFSKKCRAFHLTNDKQRR